MKETHKASLYKILIWKLLKSSPKIQPRLDSLKSYRHILRSFYTLTTDRYLDQRINERDKQDLSLLDAPEKKTLLKTSP